MSRKILFLLLALWCQACVGTGKFKALQTEKAASEKIWSEKNASLENDKQRLIERSEKINEQLTHQNTLLSELLNDKLELEKEATSLRERIVSLSSESKSLEAVLNEELQRKNENLKLKEAQLNRMINWLLQYEAKLNQISVSLGEAMTGYSQEEIEWLFEDDRLDIILYQDFMFGSGKTVSPRGQSALENLSSIIADNPSLKVFVEGHTNNRFDRASQALTASTEYAVIIGSYLLDLGDINGNQMTICGRGSYFPRVSNQTPAGRALNNRVEISLRPPFQELLSFLEQ